MKLRKKSMPLTRRSKQKKEPEIWEIPEERKKKPGKMMI